MIKKLVQRIREATQIEADRKRFVEGQPLIWRSIVGNEREVTYVRPSYGVYHIVQLGSVEIHAATSELRPVIFDVKI